MSFTDEQSKWVKKLTEAVLPALKQLKGKPFQTIASNLEWNSKKVAGEIPGESLDVDTYVRWTKGDLERLAAAQPDNAVVAKFAADSAKNIESIFGLKSNEAALADVTAMEADAKARFAAEAQAAAARAQMEAEIASAKAAAAAQAQSDASAKAEAAAAAVVAAEAETAAAESQARFVSYENGDIVDFRAHLTKLEAAHAEDLDWERSIVDLCKLLNIDSSYGARKKYAANLGYPGPDDSATMNTWLHQQIMESVGNAGGKVPPALA